MNESKYFTYDQTLSEIIYKNHSDLIKQNQCYANVFRMVTGFLDELEPSAELSVLFCYRQGVDSHYYRHAFCVFGGKIIEPLLNLDMSETNLSKIVVIRQMSVKEYLSLACTDKTGYLTDSLILDDLKAANRNELWSLLRPADLNPLLKKLSDGTIKEFPM